MNWLPWSVFRIPGQPWALDRGLQGLETTVGGQGVREAPGQDPAGRPVQHGDQVEEAVAHREVRQVHGPDLVGRA